MDGERERKLLHSQSHAARPASLLYNKEMARLV